MTVLHRDVVLAFRRLRAAPLFTGFAIVTLGLGIGATTAIYSAVYAAVLRPPAIRDIDRVANLYHSDPRQGSGPMMTFSLPDYLDYRASQTSFAQLTAWTRFREPLVANGVAEVIFGESVGGDYFRVVGVEAARGRVIQPADDRSDAPRVIVLSDGLFRRRFGSDPGVIGRAVSLGGEPYEVVGIAPPSFRGVDMPNVLPAAAWIPLASRTIADVSDREHRMFFAKGRLKPGLTMMEAATELKAIAARLDASYPIGRDSQVRMSYAVSRPWQLVPARNIRMHESVDAIAGPLATTIMIAVALVLLVACTNLANLILARGTSRQHELAVRLALGASRGRLLREQLVETTLVTAGGGLLALAIARLLMVRVLSAELNLAPGFVAQFAPEMNPPVAAAASISLLLSAVVFGVVPAVHATRASVRDALASDGPGAGLCRWRGRRRLIACQVAVSAGLIAVALLCAEQLFQSARHDSGLDLDRLAVVRLDFGMQKKAEVYGRRTLETVLEQARRQPGTEAAAVASGLPVGTGTPQATVATPPGGTREGMLMGSVVELVASTPGIFATLGVRIERGRAFDEHDVPSSERVAVVSALMEKQFTGGASLVGRSVTIQRRRFVGESVPAIETVRVIGIASDTDTGVVGRRSRGVLYLPFAQHYEPGMSVIVRAAAGVPPPVDALRRIVARTDPDLALVDSGDGITIGGAANLMMKVGAGASGLLGGLALLLAMAGLYGVLSDLVLRRKREIGVRMALGATRRELIRMIILDGTRPVIWGLAIGFGCGVVARMAFRPVFLRMLPAFDPLALAIVPLPFIAAALLASYLPARRASRVDPNVALRHL